MMEKIIIENSTSPQDDGRLKDSPLSPVPFENASGGKSTGKRNEISLSTDWSYIMWENDSNICWLDASMVLLAHNKTMRNVITMNPNCQGNKIIKGYDKAITTLNDFTSDQSTEERIKVSRDILQKVREHTLKYLQPLIKCKKGEPDSAFCSLLNLIKEDKLIQSFFDVTYMWVRLCDNCDLQRVLKTTKPMITISNVDKFLPENHISPVQCQVCKKKGQKMKLIYKKLPKCLIFHFENGAGEGKDLPLQFIVASREYQLTAVMMLEKSQESNVNHFVTYVRDASVNKWLECNDLDLDVITFSETQPILDLKDVYIYVYEALDNLGLVEIEEDPSLKISDHNIPCIDLSDEEDTNKTSQVGSSEEEFHQSVKTVTKLSSDMGQKTLNPAKHTNESQLSEKRFFDSNQDIQFSYLKWTGTMERATKSCEDKTRESMPKNKKSKINAESGFDINEFIDKQLSEINPTPRLGNATSRVRMISASDSIKEIVTNNKNNFHHETTKLSKLPELHADCVKNNFIQSKLKEEKDVTYSASSTIKKMDIPSNKEQTLIAKNDSDKMLLTTDQVEENRKVDVFLDKEKQTFDDKVDTAIDKEKILTAKIFNENRKVDMAANKEKDLTAEIVDENRKIDMEADKQRDLTAKKVDENLKIDIEVDKKCLTVEMIDESRKVDIAADKGKLCNRNKLEMLTLKKLQVKNNKNDLEKEKCNDQKTSLSPEINEGTNTSNNNPTTLNKMVNNPLKRAQILITKIDSFKTGLTATKVEVPVSKENFCNGKKLDMKKIKMKRRENKSGKDMSMDQTTICPIVNRNDMNRSVHVSEKEVSIGQKITSSPTVNGNVSSLREPHKNKKIKMERRENKSKKNMSMDQITICPIVNKNDMNRSVHVSEKEVSIGRKITISPTVNGNISNLCEPHKNKNIKDFSQNNKPCKDLPTKKKYKRKRVSIEDDRCIYSSPGAEKKAKLFPNSLIDHIANVLDGTENHSNPKQVFVRFKDSSKKELTNKAKTRKKGTIKEILEKQELFKAQTVPAINPSNDLKSDRLFGACKPTTESVLLLQNSFLDKSSVEGKKCSPPVFSDKAYVSIYQPSCSFSVGNSSNIFKSMNHSSISLSQSQLYVTEQSTPITIESYKTVKKSVSDKPIDCAVERKLSFNKSSVGDNNNKSPSKAKKNILKVKLFPQYCRKQTTDDDNDLSNDQSANIGSNVDFEENYYVYNSPSPKRRKTKVPLAHPTVSSTCKLRFACKKNSFCDIKNCYCSKVISPTVVPNSCDLFLLQIFGVSPKAEPDFS